MDKPVMATSDDHDLARDSALMEAIVLSAVDGIIVIDEQGLITLMNPAAEKLFGYAAAEVVGRNVRMLMPEPYRSRHDGFLDNYLRTGTRKIIGGGREVAGQRKDGDTFPMYLSVGEAHFDGRRLFTGIVRDLTARNQANAHIAYLERRQELILDAVGDGIIGVDVRGAISFLNPAACAMLGWERGQLIGTLLGDIWPHHGGAPCSLRRVLEGHACKGEDGCLRSRDGTLFPVEYTVTPVREAGAVVGAVFAFQDITERKQTAQELRRMRSYLKNIIDSMPSILVGVDTDGRVAEWNQHAEQVSGLSQTEAQGRLFHELFPYLESQLERVREAIRNRMPPPNQRVVFKEGEQLRYADVVVYPLVANGTLGAVIRVDDVTKRVMIEQMMVQTEKMMSVGGLAAGMAHEINNPLSAILQSCQNISRRLSSELPANRAVAEQLDLDLDKVSRYMDERGIIRFVEGIREAGTRASRIVADMLSFSRRSDSEFAPVAVIEMMDTVIRLAASDYDLKKKYDFRRIDIVRDYDPALCELICDRTEIEQVMLNLVKNAAQAMTEGGAQGSPRIVLRTRCEGDWARIEVEDNGPGMGEATRRRVFEPFFTTKPAGIGTGLGLSVSYFIIAEQHQGDISVTSSPGQGACFVIRLPRQGKRR